MLCLGHSVGCGKIERNKKEKKSHGKVDLCRWRLDKIQAVTIGCLPFLLASSFEVFGVAYRVVARQFDARSCSEVLLIRTSMSAEMH